MCVCSAAAELPAENQVNTRSSGCEGEAIEHNILVPV